jgi:hypothetical protein
MSEEELVALERNLELRGVELYGYRALIAEVRRLRERVAELEQAESRLKAVFEMWRIAAEPIQARPKRW